MIKILFVCLGNICRSPMAQFVFQNMVDEVGLSHMFEIDSAGTEGYNEMYHAGIHRGTKEILTKNNIPYIEHYSRKVRKSDYDYYDYIVTMDASNISDLKYIFKTNDNNKIKRLLDYTNNPRDIRDPWYTGNFDETFEDVNEGAKALLNFFNFDNV